MENLKTKVTIFVTGAAVGAALLYWLYPRYVTKTEVKTQTEIRNNIRTITRTVERPDGTREIMQERVDTSKTSAKTSAIKLISKPNYLVGATAGTQFNELKPIYGGHLSMRVLGPVFLGLYGRQDGEFGIVLNMEL